MSRCSISINFQDSFPFFVYLLSFKRIFFFSCSLGVFFNVNQNFVLLPVISLEAVGISSFLVTDKECEQFAWLDHERTRRTCLVH